MTVIGFGDAVTVMLACAAGVVTGVGVEGLSLLPPHEHKRGTTARPTIR
jgi:hypothetical protein